MAKEISRKGHEVIILEQHSRAGEETSSRNSGVIHSGIYYPTGSNKATLCVEGNRLLYEYAKGRNIWHRNTGKLVIASTSEEEGKLESLVENGKRNNVEDLELISKKRIHRFQPEILAESALYCPSSGIIDAAELILSLETEVQQKDIITSYNSEVEEIEVSDSTGITLHVRAEESFTIEADNVINSAGLHAVDLARKIKGIPEGILPKSYFAKGHYFQLSGNHPFKKHLVYPLPTKDSLGVHLSFDVSGKVKFGPDVFWIEGIDYSFNESRKDDFVSAIKTYWPDLNPDKLFPDYTGIRPKIYGPTEEPADFVIQTSKQHKIKGLVNLFGIESPGLTCSLPLAKKVANLLF